jgi:hypothetical protein
MGGPTWGDGLGTPGRGARPGADDAASATASGPSATRAVAAIAAIASRRSRRFAAIPTFTRISNPENRPT